MTRFLELLRFEVGYQTKQPAFAVTFLLLLTAGFFATSSEDIQRARGITTLVNGPYAVTMTHLTLSIIAMFMVGHFIGRAATRDRAHRMDGLMLATSIPASARLWGQLNGATAVCFLAFLAVSIGSVAGTYWPEVSQDQRGPFTLAPLIWTYVVFVLPNLWFCAVMLFALARVLRSMMGMYLGLVGFFVVYEVASVLLDNPDSRSLAALLDPFGFSAFAEATRYWTAEEKNSRLVSFSGLVSLNRWIWFSVAGCTLALLSRFHNERKEARGGRRRVRQRKTPASNGTPTSKPGSGTNWPSGWVQFLARTRLEVIQVIGSPSFLILSLLTSFMLIAGLIAGDSYYATRSWPLTRMLSETIQGSMSLLILIVLSYYAAETTWRERQTGMDLLIDATPVSNGKLFLPKLVALWTVIIGLLMVGVAIATVYQTATGWHRYEWWVYLQTLTLQYLLPAMLIAVLSLLIQTLSPGKYVGMAIFAGYVVASLVAPQLGLEHHLWRYSEGPEAIYSDMNGLGHFLPSLVAYNVYWSLVAGGLAIAGYGMWPRGLSPSFTLRFRVAKQSVGRRGVFALVALLGLASVTGGFIYYNTNILNDYESSDRVLDWRADYERTLKRFEAQRPPIIRDVKISADLFPGSRRIVVQGHYLLRNETDLPLKEMLLSWDPRNTVEYRLEGSKVAQSFPHLAAIQIALTDPLMPGDERMLWFSVDRVNRGFKESQVDSRAVGNGTFINNQELLPRIGYDADQELTDRAERAQRGLDETKRLAALEDDSQYWRTYLGADVHKVRLHTTLSTTSEQTAIAPGKLVRQWQQDGRRYFEYQTQTPVLNYFAIQSGRYAIHRESHNGVSIEVYHHPEHWMNVERMVEAVKHSLDFFGTAFGPYQYPQLRIIEFPRYVRFAQSFANTIPYSEDIGFVADLRSKSAIDYVYSVTAHELAHQWWGHQLAPANVKGGTVLSESLAQYSAYMLIRDRYGDAYLRRFLKWELDRYLRGRSNEVDEEQVLMRAENKPYIHYQKGGLILYALQDMLGAERMHRALRRLLAAFRDEDARFATVLDLLGELRREADAPTRQFIADSFEHITLYDFSVESATGHQLPTGRYQIDVTILSGKFQASGSGRSTQVEMNELIDVGLLNVHPDAPLSSSDAVQISQHQLTGGKATLTLSSDSRPAFVTVDPFLKRIDRNSQDNTMAVNWR
ncbi:MAG: M1 family aminopeptidase [Pseudomonadota bacterium]